MIILVTITAVALIAILVLIPKPIVPEYTVISPQTVCWDQTKSVTIGVFSQNDDPINDAAVTLDGPNVTVSDKTRGNGEVTFSVTAHTSNPNPGTSTINVEASFGNVRITNTIPVNVC